MPIYEYHCKDCDYYFDVNATIKEKETGLVVFCERCGSKNLQQVFGGFAFIGSQTVNVRRNDSQNSGGGCCGGSGSGCC